MSHYFDQSNYMNIYHQSALCVQPLELVDQSIGKKVHVITIFGVEYTGILNGIDPSVNCVLSDADEVNVLSPDTPPKRHNMVLVSGAHISIILPFVSDSE